MKLTRCSGIWLSLSAGALMACGASGSPGLASQEEAIIGGQADTTDLAVFLLSMKFNNNNTASCSGTLIGTRSLLTAAHCIDPARQGAASVVIQVTNDPSSVSAPPSDYITASSYGLHPQWDPNTVPSPYDCAMVLLPAPPPQGTPQPWNSVALPAITGSTVLAIGYGRTSSSVADTGTRHSVSVTVNSVASDSFAFGTSGVSGICDGDSGGPSLYTFTDGVAREVGYHSYTTSASCGDGVDVRTDFVASFVTSWLAANDVAPGPDAGSEPPDAGTTTPPDAGTSQAPDSGSGDVVAAGAYCTPGISVCVAGTVCDGVLGLPAQCQTACPSGGVCPGGAACVTGGAGKSYCESTGGPPSIKGGIGCGSVPGGWEAIQMVAILGFLRRRTPR